MKTHTLILLLASTIALPAAITPGDTDLGAIWFVGDSITQSNADGDPDGSPRKSLYDLLESAGYTFTYTGHHSVNFDGLPATGATPATNLYDYHSGVSGSVIGNDTSGRHGMTQNLPSHWTSGRLATVKPNVILIMLGTNDVNADIDRANAPARLTAYLDAIYSQAGIGTPTVLVASIPPNRTSTASPDKRVWVSEFNAGVPGVVGAQRALGRDVHFVDQFTPLENGYATLMAGDNLHATAAGNDSLAQQWFAKIEAIVDGAAATGTGSLVATGDSASADTDNSSEAGRATVRAFVADIAGDDLIQAGSATLVGAVMDKAPSTVVGPGTPALNDGLGYPATGGGTGTFLPETFGSGNKLPFTYTATLDTSVNSAGYDVSAIRTFAGWSQNGSALANQKYELLVSQVGDSGFTSLGTYTYAPFEDSNPTEAGSTRLVLSHPSGTLASGVDEVRFVFENHGFDNHANTVDGSLYHEVDVIGTPTALPIDYGIAVSGVSFSEETDNSGAAGYPAASAYSADIATDDLINAGQPSVGVAGWDKIPFFTFGTVNDGTGHTTVDRKGSYLPATFGTGTKMPFTYTANLDLTANGLGYTISEIRSFAGWNQNGAALANQKYELLVSRVGDPAFESLGIYEYSPFDNASTAEAGSSKMTLTPDDGVIATGVDAVRFVVMDHGFSSAAGDTAINGSVIHEFDVIGEAVPVPDAGLISLQGSSFGAETDNSSAAGYPAAATYLADILDDDLINAGQASVASYGWDKTPYFSFDTVNDGTGHATDVRRGTYLPETLGSGAKLPFTYTANLDLTDAPGGYRITGFQSFAGWNQNGAALANQKYELLVSPVGNPGFYSLGTFEYSPFNDASTEEAGATKVVLTADDGVLADHVDAVRIVALNHGFSNVGAADGTVYFEFDVIGAASGQGFGSWASGFGIAEDEDYDNSDNDGIPALMEYALGLSPLVSEVLPALDGSISPPRITWPKGAEAAADPEIRYSVLISDDLMIWEDPQPGEVVEAPDSVTLDLSLLGSRRFARLEVTRTLP